MKKQDILSLVQLLLVPVLLILLGLILVVNPDTASVLISKLLGYVLTLCAIGTGLAAIFSRTKRVMKGICAVVLAMVGGWLMMHPLWLTAWISRFLGMLILVNSGMDLIFALKQNRNVIFHAAAAAVGALLILAVFLPDMITFKKKEEEPEDPSSRIDAAEEENKRLKEELEKLREEMAKKEAE